MSKKNLKFEKCSQNTEQKTRIKAIGQPPLSFKKSITLLLIIIRNVSKIDENCLEKYGKCEGKFHKTLYLNNSCKKP